ncbi:histone-lysine N-methyltransferase SETD1B-like [Penaeus chinensis]|uniref:histone-lysine N-methyltransferase SETD1B-like n=1 Tax=Penaeus chinensis TaxID=139456 RepID=UPI001FB82DCF|nr:histone-lysine N-methyltransferase SETD1B-like [Penaeus chinensis]
MARSAQNQSRASGISELLLRRDGHSRPAPPRPWPLAPPPHDRPKPSAMLQTSIPLVLTGLIGLSACLPVTDQANQRNALYPLVRGSDRTIPLSKMRPYRVRNDDNIKCTGEGFFAHPKNCSQFYRCVDIANTGMHSTVFFECAAGTVFAKELETCLPGVCLNQPPPPQGPPLKDPMSMMPQWNPSQNSTSGSTDDTLPPSPPPPPPPPPPSTSSSTAGTIGSTSVQIPIEALPMPAWFNSTPWWYNTPPAWFNQTPDWFKPSNAQIISEEIVIEEDLLRPDLQAVGHQGNFSVDGIDASLSKDNKTIKIHIPIKIVQQ